MEGILSGGLGDVLVRADAGGFKGLARELLVFVGDKVSAEGEVIDGSTLSAQVEDPDLALTSATDREPETREEDFGIRNTPVVSRLGVRLVLAVAVAASWTTSHLGFCMMNRVSERAHPSSDPRIHRFCAGLRFERGPSCTHNVTGGRDELLGWGGGGGQDVPKFLYTEWVGR